jgi:hypothetical protein
MGRRRRNYNDKEYAELERLKHENQKLKRQVSALRKQISRLDVDRYNNVKELLEKQANDDAYEYVHKEKQKAEQQWRCYSCGSGVLRTKRMHRRDGSFYYRKCDNEKCTNRTNTKPIPPDGKIEGVD